MSQVAASESNHTRPHATEDCRLGRQILIFLQLRGLFAPRTNHDFNNARNNLQQSANEGKNKKTKQTQKIAFARSTATDADEMLVRIQSQIHVEIVLIIGFCQFERARAINPIHRFSDTKKNIVFCIFSTQLVAYNRLSCATFMSTAAAASVASGLLCERTYVKSGG